MPTGSGKSTTDPNARQADRGARDALVELIRSHPSLASVEVLRLSVPPSVENRPGSNPRHQVYADEARKSRLHGDSFTNSFLAAADRNNDLVSALSVVDYHQRFKDAPFSVEISRDQFTSEKIDELSRLTPHGQMLVLTSRVRTSEGPKHVPLLDFKISASHRNEDAARFVSRRLGGGLLVNSGSSYHLFGSTLMDTEELVAWLLHAQLFSRCVDTRWVTHQLIEQCAALRLSRGGSRNAWPELVAAIPQSAD